MDEDSPEIGYGRAVDRSQMDAKAFIMITSELDQILSSYGDERENGNVDISWSSYELGAHLLLLRGTWSGETQYVLYITEHELDEDECERESTITFTPSEGVTGITGAVCAEISEFGVGEWSEMAEIIFVAYIDTYTA